MHEYLLAVDLIPMLQKFSVGLRIRESFDSTCMNKKIDIFLMTLLKLVMIIPHQAVLPYCHYKSLLSLSMIEMREDAGRVIWRHCVRNEEGTYR